MAFPPLEFGFLVFVAPVPLLWGIRRTSGPQHAFWVGFFYGVVFFGILLYWIVILGAVALIPLIFGLAVYAGLYAALLSLANEWSPWRWWIVAVGGWGAWEFFRARGPLDGFPWGSVGLPIGSMPWPRGAAQWIGPTGWGILVVALAAGIVLMFEEERDRRMFEVSAVLIVLLTVAGAIAPPSPSGLAIDVAIVQGNSPCPRVHCDNEKAIIYTSHLTATRELEPGTIDLVVWGEDSFGGSVNPTYNGEVRSQMSAEAARLSAYLLAGGTRPAGAGRFENYNIVFAPDGTIVGEYLKTHPVPFGEYVPFRRALRFIPQLDAVPNDMVRGPGPVVFPVTIDDEDHILGSVISFESAFIRTTRAEVRAGAELLVVATNEGSFGASPSSDQLIAMVRMSAVSLGVDVVHAAVTGRSTFISADGTIGPKTDLFVEDVLFGTVRFRDGGRTFYTFAGDYLQVGMMLAALWVLIAYRRRRDFKIKPQRRR